MKILIVEDDPRLGETLRELMKSRGWETDLVDRGDDGLFYGRSGIYDVIILDVMLPGMNGFDIAEKLRRDRISTPVLMLTARTSSEDKVQGLDSGADDYLTKPFDPEELFARIRALTRRTGEVILDTMEYGDLSLNVNSGELSRESRSVRLSARELAVMKALMSARGAAVSKDELINRAWDMADNPGDNNVEVYISFIRKKLRFLGTDVKISTARRIGYYLEE